jgi:hypothetical protein
MYFQSLHWLGIEIYVANIEIFLIILLQYCVHKYRVWRGPLKGLNPIQSDHLIFCFVFDSKARIFFSGLSDQPPSKGYPDWQTTAKGVQLLRSYFNDERIL